MSTSPEAKSDTRPESGPGLFADPLANWSNDDILLTKPARATLGEKHLRGLRVLDWPELRAQFARHEAPANRNARRDRRLSLGSVTLGAAGLILAGFVPVAGEAAVALGAVAAFCCFAGFAFGALNALDRGSRARWLGHRFWTERMRALYFQTLINNLPLVTEAMRDDRALGLWKAARAAALAALPTSEDASGQMGSLAGPARDEEAWVVRDWVSPPDPPKPSDELDIVLTLLRAQRFDSQIAYTDQKLGDSLRAPRRRSHLLRLADVWAPVLAAVAAIAAGLMALFGLAADGVEVRIALGLAAAALVAALSSRMINDDLNLSGDAARYAAYGAAVQAVRARFDAGDVGEKLAALREMEIIAYRDLREFVAAHWRRSYRAAGGRIAAQTFSV